MPIVKATIAYEYIIVHSQALYLGNHLDYSLLCPNQLQHKSTIVDGVPIHLAPDLTEATHSIFVPEERVRIPLAMRSVASLFHTRTPKTEELEMKP
jgi:hypothetical protein